MYVSVTMTKQNLTVFLTLKLVQSVLMSSCILFRILFLTVRLDCIFLSFYSYMSVLHNMEMII